MLLTCYRLTCDDHDGCPAAWPAEGWSVDHRQAWRQAKAAGWAREHDRTLCPQHSPDAELAARVRRLAGQLSDARIGERLGLSRSQVQDLRSRHGIAGLRPGRPAGATAGCLR